MDNQDMDKPRKIVKAKGRKQSKGELELRARFHQQRFEALTNKADRLMERIKALQSKHYEISSEAHEQSERAAGCRGLVGAMKERGHTHMRAVDGLCEFTKEVR